MRSLFLFCALSLSLGQPRPSLAVECVNWVLFPKYRPWDFEATEPPKNHANIDPTIILDWIDVENKEMRSVDRAKRAAKIIVNGNFRSFAMRAVLMRDVFDAIHNLELTYSARDLIAENGVLFIGRAFDQESRYALALSFENGLFYRGMFDPALHKQTNLTIDFADTTIWKIIE